MNGRCLSLRASCSPRKKCERVWPVLSSVSVSFRGLRSVEAPGLFRDFRRPLTSSSSRAGRAVGRAAAWVRFPPGTRRPGGLSDAAAAAPRGGQRDAPWGGGRQTGVSRISRCADPLVGCHPLLSKPTSWTHYSRKTNTTTKQEDFFLKKENPVFVFVSFLFKGFVFALSGT